MAFTSDLPKENTLLGLPAEIRNQIYALAIIHSMPLRTGSGRNNIDSVELMPCPVLSLPALAERVVRSAMRYSLCFFAAKTFLFHLDIRRLEKTPREWQVRARYLKVAGVDNLSSIVLHADVVRKAGTITYAEIRVAVDAGGSLKLICSGILENECACAIEEGAREVERTTMFSSYDRLFTFVNMFEKDMLSKLEMHFPPSTTNCTNCGKQKNYLNMS